MAPLFYYNAIDGICQTTTDPRAPKASIQHTLDLQSGLARFVQQYLAQSVTGRIVRSKRLLDYTLTAILTPSPIGNIVLFTRESFARILLNLLIGSLR